MNAVPLNTTSVVDINDELYESSSDDDDGYDYDPEITLRSIERSKTINFSISANYTRWKPREAFRELVQNWRDAIIKTFHLAERDFCVVREEKISGRNTEIIYKIPRFDGDGGKEWLGYIRFKARDDEGSIEITNRSATLQPCHLDLGSTSKAGDWQQAGAHGEGLKIAILVLMRGRQNHSIRCRSGGFDWKFNFTTQGRLVARLRRMSPEIIRKNADLARRLSMRTGNLLPFAVEPNGDVQFVIGENQRGRNEKGILVKRNLIKRKDFEAWTAAALFLQDAGNGAIISTEVGDLLTSSQLRGNIYLKGLLLKESTPERSASITNRPLKFGYNFAFGNTNRERQSVDSADEESRAILAIWNSVLATRPQMVQELDAMLNTSEPDYADVSGAKRLMNLGMATRLKEYLCGEQFVGKWYYGGEEKSKTPRLDHIIQGLGCEGVELAEAYWTILRRHNLIRTAEEEERRRFIDAPLVEVPETIFATSVCRLLRACARACHQTRGINICFVQAGQLHLQLFFSQTEQLFRIHERCLSVNGAISELGLPDDLQEADIIYHTVKRLFADALEQLPRDLFLDDNIRTADWHRKLEISRAEQRLLNYLRVGNLRFEMFTLAKHSEFRESWTVISKWIQGNDIEIQCHRASRCSSLRETLLIAEDARLESLACIARMDEDMIGQQSSEPGFIAAERPACQVYRYDELPSEQFDHQLEGGEEYFIVLATPTDQGSFVVLSSNGSLPQCSPRLSTSVIEPKLSVDERRVTATQTSHAAENSALDYSSPDVSATDEFDTMEDSLSPEPALANINGRLPPASVPNTVRMIPVTQPLIPTRVSAPATSFVLGPQLQSLNIFEISSDRWYEAQSLENVRAVIGIMQGQEYLPEETRKRRRVDRE